VVAIRRAVWRAVAQSCAAEAEELVAEVAEAAPDLEAVAEAALVQAELAELVGQLPARLGRVIRGSYGLAAEATETYAALGRKLGVSRQRAHQMHSEALLWLGQPARSLRLRQRVGANTRGDYAAYQARVRAFQRRKRGRR
jgi:DNA-directed RNA polymerase sigma subunit (sigma70/sigma32)